MTLDELTAPLTLDEARAAIYAACVARGLATTTWKPGAVVRTIIAALAVLVVAFSRLQAAIAKSGFLAEAEGDWLTLVARYVYGVERDMGSFATGEITLDNGAGGSYSGGPGDLVVLNPTTNKSYRNTASFSIGSMETGVVVPVEALELGSASTSVPDAITAFVTTLSGVSVTNAAAVIGTDAELDPTLRLRCAEKTGMLSPNGARDAYAYVARSTKNTSGASIGVTRVRAAADGDGNVTVYVATGSGGVTGDADDPDTDLGAINKALQEQVVPLAVTATVASASSLAIDVSYELWVSNAAALSDDAVKALVEAALIEWISDRPIGGDLLPAEAVGRVYVSGLEAVIGNTAAGALRVVVTLPADDVDCAANGAPVAGTIVCTALYQVAGAVL